MRFTKLHGLGNDYIYIDCTKSVPDDLPGLARAISDRRYGAGSDGLICICSSDKADFKMRMLNADGSEGQMCGNGIRCFAKFVYDKGMTDKTDLTVETGAGLRTLKLEVKNGQMQAATVDMGEPGIGETMELTVKGKNYTATPASVGSHHIVIFEDGIDGLDLADLGPRFENHPAFPDRINTEFVEVTDRTHLKMRVWERGSGETWACGTGACATLVASVLKGKADRQATVCMRGGELHISWDEASGHIYMTGPAVTVYEGEWPEA